ncbi:competence damage-inducible protein A [Kaistia sp. 32K]|uniref:CinA family protein n=1 Tax=Kaistia sp. 32K TaxID=2795690 RepID=UPI0019150C7E|nr:CinA family protein [Kaistia sp. 32K]BCP53461.1 competence damage-inducible protein A [Kaistia sp. 32K]
MTDLTPLEGQARALIELCIARGLKIATAESCTGGLIAGVLTEISGSSAVVDRGFVTYSNEAKTEMIGVSAELIQRVGAVSQEVALAMAAGALAKSGADLAVAVTGIAGPTGGSPDKPVGLVHFGVMRRGSSAQHAVHVFADRDRSGVRFATVAEALKLLAEAAEG